jgi:hypothetical protein
MQRAVIQRKSMVSAPTDAYEEEADRLSESLMHADAVVEAPCDCGGTCASCASKHGRGVQMKRSARGPAPAEAPPIVQESVRASGHPLDAATRGFFEPRLGTDLGDVRVHTDSQAATAARAIRAEAFTLGSDVVFASGRYQPHSDGGRRLLGHELVHVIQQREGSHVVQQKPDASGEELIQSYVFMGPKTLANDTAFAEQSGTAMAKRVQQRGKLVHDDRIEMNGMLAFFEGEAKGIYAGKIRPALYQVTTSEIEMPEDVVRPRSYVFAGEKRLATDVEYARRRGAELGARIRKAFAVSWDDRLEMEGMKAFFKAEAYKAYVAELQPALASLEPTAESFVAGFWVQSKFLWVKSPALFDVAKLGAQLATYVTSRPAPAAFVRDVFAKIPEDREDEVGAEFIHRVEDYTLIGLASTPDGRAALDIVYQAIVTGDVTDFQRKQSDRILQAQSEHLTIGEGNRLLTFPIRNIGVTRYCSATFRASLRPNGRVFVRYTSIKVDQCDMFKKDLESLGGWSRVRDGFELDPKEIVTVKVYEESDTPPPQPVPAVALIDFANQIQQSTIGTATTAFATGLTIGWGGLSGAGVKTWGGRALLWGDRVATFLPVLAMVLRENRGWIIQHFGDAGKRLLDAVDTANTMATYYGFGRLGFDGLRFVGGKVRPAWQEWRAKTGNLKEADVRLARDIDVGVESLLREVDNAAASKIEKPNQAVDFVNDNPHIVEGKAGHRRAKVNEEHDVIEVMDASKPSGIGCKFYSPIGIPVDCPRPMGKGPVEPAPAAVAHGQAPTTAAELTVFLKSLGLRDAHIERFGTPRSGLTPPAVRRIRGLAEHFNPEELRALGDFLYRHKIYLSGEAAEMLIAQVKRGALVERLASMEVALTQASSTAILIDPDGTGITVPADARRRPEPKVPPGPVVGPSGQPVHVTSQGPVPAPSQLAEEQLLPALEKTFGHGWQYHPRVRAPGADEGELLGSTLPEYYHRHFKTAFEVKRWRLNEMGIGPAGENVGALSKQSVESLQFAQQQLVRRRWAMGDEIRQDIVFNVTGQGVTNVSAVGARLQEFLRQHGIAYDHLWIQNGDRLTNIF